MALQSSPLLAKLAELANNKDRAGYYRCLLEHGDKYGELALSVVIQNEDGGRVARDYAFEVANRYGQPLSEESWTAMSVALMLADFSARQAQSPGPRRDLDLPWDAIRGYHNAVFVSQPFSLPVEAWTAEIPLLLAGDPADTWHHMLYDDFLTTSARIVRLVAQSVPPERQQEFMECLVNANIPIPFVPGIGSSYRLQRLMDESMLPAPERMRRQQIGHGNGLTDKQNRALFYMDVIGCGLYTPRYFWNDLFGWIAPVPASP